MPGVSKLGDLGAMGIDHRFIQCWRRRWQREGVADVALTPLQSRVLSDGRSLAWPGRDLVVTGPTSSGKTLVAEAMMARVLSGHTNRRCIYLVPLRALVTEKMESLREIFGNADV